LVLDVIPAGCKRVVDVACGNGGLTRALRGRGVPEVVGIDRDGPCIKRCKSHPGAGDISYVAGDVLACPLEAGSFNLVSAVASLHHMGARAALARLRDLVAPGGVLIVIGLARPYLAVAGALWDDAAPGCRTASQCPLAPLSAVAVLPGVGRSEVTDGPGWQAR
jgi:2-polyprenyl-3-methyl-5-hydroxy-6-metoxy-1,4-benzoquinol methylase